MVHGDIKPNNVLLFQQEAWKYGEEMVYAKLADFGYAGWSSDPSKQTPIYLPRSRPWEAPEYHHRGFSIQQAKQLDIFSLGLSCLWFLFHDKLTKIDPCSSLIEQSSEAELSAWFQKQDLENAFHNFEAIENAKLDGLL